MRAMRRRFDHKGAVCIACLLGTSGCERPVPLRQHTTTRAQDSAQNSTAADAATSDAMRSSSVVCPNKPALKVERTTDLRRECSLDGEYDATNYCVVAAALRGAGFKWDREFVVDESDSRDPIQLSKYRAPKGSLILNPRVHGEVVVDAEHSELHFYCTEVSQDHVRLVLRRVITP